MIFELAQDFHNIVAAMPAKHSKLRILELLEEAIRRDIHFINRHPTTLFQCMWNSCWWYDCPEVATHYVNGGDKWNHSGHKLSCLLDTWRIRKEETVPGFRWVRNLRPPAMHLGATQRAVLRGHTGWVRSVEYSPDGRRILSVGENIRIWDAVNSEIVTIITGKGTADVAVYSLDGDRIFGGSSDGTIRIWEADTGKRLMELSGHTANVNCIACFPDRKHIISGSSDNTLRIWDTNSGREIGCLRGHEDGVRCVAITPDGMRVISGSDDNTVRMWDLAAGTEEACLRGHKDDITSVIVTPDGTRIVSGAADGTLRIWDIRTGSELLCLYGHKAFITSVTCCPDGHHFASGSDDRTIRIWDVESGEEQNVLIGHEWGITCLHYSPDGRYIVSGSIDKTLVIWDVAETGSPAIIPDHDDVIGTIAFSPETNSIITSTAGYGGKDTKTGVWDAISGVCYYLGPKQDFRTKQTIPNLVPMSAFVYRNVETVFVYTMEMQPFAYYLIPEEYPILPENVADAKPFASYPVGLDRLASHPFRPVFAGAAWPRYHLYIVMLEGENNH